MRKGNFERHISQINYTGGLFNEGVKKMVDLIDKLGDMNKFDSNLEFSDFCFENKTF